MASFFYGDSLKVVIRHYPIRAASLWLALHAFLAIVSGGEVLMLGTPGTLVLALIGAVVGYADTQRRHEYLLLGNLGIHAATPSAVWGATIVVAEILFRIAGSVAGLSS